MTENISRSARLLISLTTIAFIALFLFLCVWLATYPQRYDKAEIKFNEAVKSGYTVIYDGVDITELGFKEIYNKYILNYLPSQKKILAEKAILNFRSRIAYYPLLR